MAKNFNLKKTHAQFGAKRCERIMSKSPYVKAGYQVGIVCQSSDGTWGYNYVGGAQNTLYGAHKTKTAALKQALKSYRSWVGY